MPDGIHTQLAAHVLGRLSPEESALFAEHLVGCERCRAEEVELRAVTALLRDTAPSAPPAELEARTLAAIASLDEATDGPRLPGPLPTALNSVPSVVLDELAARRASRLLRLAAAAGAVAAGLAVAFVVGTGTAEDTTTTIAEVRTVTNTSLPGDREKVATLRGDGFSADARVNVVGPGRLVEVKSDTVPVIPTGTYYELWFVGPGDTPRSPNRISAGTWHPDKRGKTDVRFLIAADPKLFPDIEVTEEPPDGDPAPSNRVVLTSD